MHEGMEHADGAVQQKRNQDQNCGQTASVLDPLRSEGMGEGCTEGGASTLGRDGRFVIGLRGVTMKICE